MKRKLLAIFFIVVVFTLTACDKRSTSTSGASYQMETCTSCKGDGLCNVCDGAGKNSYSGQAARTCTICGGGGVCKLCGGSGSVMHSTNSQAQNDAIRHLDQEGGKGNRNSYSTGSVCGTCKGNGYLDMICSWCDGSGIDSAWEATKGKAVHSFAEKACPSCNGNGRKKCYDCSGTGRVY